jgi:hypothetical protein
MPPVTLAAVVDLSKIKMKWKETYVSEGLNRKVIPAAPKGIYRGLKLIQNISSPRQVEVSVGSDGSHAAVHQSATGFSTTYHDVAGVSTILNLSSASLDNQETVITLSINYTIGADTTANWIAYPIADWNALTDAQRAEKIVLGTVNVPAPATNITTAMITPNRRTVAWDSESPGNVPWSPVLKNPSFEHGVTTSTARYSISDWDKGTLVTNGNFRLGTTTIRSGAKSLEYNKTNVAASSGSLVQYLETPVVAGQLVRVTGWIRQLIAPTGGSILFTLVWGNMDSVSTTPTDITASVLSATDAGFRKIDVTVAAPTGSFVLKSFAVVINGVTAGSTGVLAAFDDIQVFVETGSPQAIQSFANSRLRQQMVSSMLFESGDTFQIGELAGLMYFNKASPASEGSLVLERKDQDYSGANLPPAFQALGRMILGSQLLATETKALLPRISADVSVVGGVDFTLMWESKPTGQPGFRMYVSPNGSMIETYNAIWGGTTWAKDVGGIVAVKRSMTNLENRVDLRHAVNNAAWADGSWDQTAMNETWGNPISTWQIVASANISGDVTLGNNSSVVLSGASGLYKHGTRTVKFMTNNGRAAFLSGPQPSNITSESFGTGSTAAGTWFFPLDMWPTTWRLTAARFYLPSTIVGSGGLLTLQERNPGASSYTSISSDYSFTAGESGLKSFSGITPATHSNPLGIRMNLSVGSTTTALVSQVELDYDVI